MDIVIAVEVSFLVFFKSKKRQIIKKHIIIRM